MGTDAAVRTDTPEARRYSKLQRRLSFADVALTLATLAVVLATGWTRDFRDWTTRLAGGQNYVLALFIYVLILALLSKVITAPLDYYGFRLEHDFHLSNQRIGSWLRDQLKAFLIGFGVSTLLTQILYLIMRKEPMFWWIICWLVFLVLFVLFAQLAPVLLFPLFYRFKALGNESLRARLTRLSERAGTRVRGVYEWNLSEKSNKANAALVGMGATRRIVLADTLLANYSEDEIEAVLAHELGHHVRWHMARTLIVHAAVTFAAFWAIKTAIRHYTPEPFYAQSDFANLPLIVLVTTVLSLILMPLLNAISRMHEREADRYALRSISSVDPFISAMDKLAQQNLSEREPSRWIELLFHSHPSIDRRISAARAYAARQAQQA